MAKSMVLSSPAVGHETWARASYFRPLRARGVGVLAVAAPGAGRRAVRRA